MFHKILPISAAALMLLLASFSVNAMKMECGTMTPDECRMEMGRQMDRMTMMRMNEMLRMEMMKIEKLLTETMNDLPKDSMHFRTMKEATIDMKTEMAMMDRLTMMRMMETMQWDMMKMMETMMSTMKMDEKMTPMMKDMGRKMKMDMMMMHKMRDTMTMEMMRRTMADLFMAMQPDMTRAQMSDEAHRKTFEEVSKKHGGPEEMLEEDMVTMMMELGKMWMEMMDGMREEDMKTMPEMTELKTMIKTMMDTKDTEEKMMKFLDTMKMMGRMMHTPFIKAMMMTMSMFKDN